MANSHPIHSLQVPIDILDCLLNEFDEVINSKRLRSRIRHISELIDVLWKRLIFSTDESALVTICKNLSNSEQRAITRSYANSLMQNGNPNNFQNVYAKIRANPTLNHSGTLASPSQSSKSEPNRSASSEQRQTPATGANNLNADKRQQIFNYVCNNIDYWYDFGRCLGMRDVELNNISQDLTLRNDVKLFTYRILERVEAESGNKFYGKLHEALIEAKRKDMARNIKKLM